MAERRFYWLKLDKDFFKSKRVKKLRKLPGGDTLLVIFMKLQCLSIDTLGTLEFTGIEDSFAEELALDLDEDPEQVATLIDYLLKTGLLVQNENEYCLPFVEESIGSECASAERVRNHRKSKSNANVTTCNADVTQVKQISNVDIDIDIDIDKDIEKEIEKEIDKRDREEKEIERDIDIGVSAAAIQLISFAEDNFERKLSTSEKEALCEYADNPKLAEYAITKAILNQKKSIGYVEGILKSWKKKGITKVSDARTESKKNGTPNFTADEMEAEEVDFNELHQKLRGLRV